MAGVVQAARYIQVGGKRIPVKKFRGFAQLVARATLEASAEQSRVLAEETRTLLIDKLLAATPDAPGVAKAVGKPPQQGAVRTDIPTTERKPFKHEPLAERTIRNKMQRELDARKLIATGAYIEGIEVRKFVLPKVGVAWGVGMADRVHEPSGLPLVALAKILERGSATAKMPARPHWRVVWRNIQRRIREKGLEAQAEGLRRALRGMR